MGVRRSTLLRERLARRERARSVGARAARPWALSARAAWACAQRGFARSVGVHVRRARARSVAVGVRRGRTRDVVTSRFHSMGVRSLLGRTPLNVIAGAK